MRQGADGEKVDAGCGDVSRGGQGDAAAGFELAAPAAGPNQVDRRANRVDRHVVEQHQISAGLDRLAHLLNRVAFDFYRQVRKRSTYGPVGRPDSTSSGYVVVFDQRGVSQRQAMVDS